MKRIIIFFGVTIINISLFSQNTFCLIYEEEEHYNNFMYSVETDNELYIIHFANKYRENVLDVQYGSILKLDEKGQILKEKKFINSDSSIFLNDIIKSQNRIFAYSTKGNNSFKFWDLDESLNIINEKEYIFSDFENRKITFIRCQHNFDKTAIYLTGNLWDTIYSIPKEAFIMKFSPKGDSLDTKIIQKEDQVNIYSQSSFLNRDSIVFSTVETGTEHFLYIMNSNMEIIDSSSVSYFGMYGADMLEGEAELLSDDTIVYACDFDADVYETRLSIWDTCFNKINEIFIGKPDSAVYTAHRNLEIAKDGNILLGQTLYPGPVPFPGPYPSWFALNKFDPDLNLIWQKFYGGDSFYRLQSITATEDGGCLLSGSQWRYNTGDTVNAYLLKVDEFGNGPESSIHEQDKIKAHELILYPNPGSNQLNIRTAVQRLGGEFTMYNVTGKLVLNQKITQSITEVNTQYLPSGTYIYSYTHKGKKIESGKWVKQ